MNQRKMKNYIKAVYISVAIIGIGWITNFHALSYAFLAFFAGYIVTQSFTINFGPKDLKAQNRMLLYENLVRKNDEEENFRLKNTIRFWEDKYRILLNDTQKLVSLTNELQKRRLGFNNKALLSDLTNTYKKD